MTAGADGTGSFVTDSIARDGRRVPYCLYGPSTGRPVVFEYGTPGFRQLSPSMVDAALRAGAQLLVVDRPGFGGSDRYKGRAIVDVVGDVVGVVNSLGWDSFAIWGGSGGAPHALACAAVLGSRVTRCASVVGPAPFDAEGLDWYAGMSPGNVEEFTAAAIGEGAYRPLVQRLAEEAVASVESGSIQVADDYHLPESDLVALRARRTEDGYVDRMRATYTGGIDGWIDDCIAMTRPWGFDLQTLAVPISVWYGPDDVLSPRGHAEHLLTAIPHAQRQELPAGGHVLSTADLAAIYHWLLHP
ncbi:alpha/beta fold hydrolase [Kribbella sp. NPDC051952]|uniref:alpha/beta fold hydrolase n=1 Tax=Kribbella sp. NPDC051952 TaxID=3154851 RepID=UPI00342D1478